MNGGVYHPHCAQDAMYPKFTEARVREIVREEIAIEAKRVSLLLKAQGHRFNLDDYYP
jgi:hypothetical protein